VTLVRIEPFEDLSSVDAYSSNTSVSSTIVAPRTGGFMRCGASSHWGELRLPAPWQDTITMGFAWKTSGLSSSVICQCFELIGGQVQVSIGSKSDGAFELMRSSSVVATTAAGLYVANQWYYLEVQTKVHQTAGTLTLRLNGTQIGTFAGDTQTSSTNSYVSAIRLATGSANNYFDDLYICAAATTPDPFLGDCVVEMLVPNGNGAVNQFAGSDGDSVNNWELVDEVPVVADTYVVSSTPGHQDLYTLSALAPSTAPVLAVSAVATAAKRDVAARALKPLIRRGVTTAGAAQPLLDENYLQVQTVWTVDPETGSAWTPANVDALQAGMEVA
jgi:archaellin